MFSSYAPIDRPNGGDDSQFCFMRVACYGWIVRSKKEILNAGA